MTLLIEEVTPQPIYKEMTLILMYKEEASFLESCIRNPCWCIVSFVQYSDI
jgi:hypothetical protein